MAGSTQPTYQFDRQVAPGTFTGTLDVAFGALTVVTANFNVTMPDGKAWDLVGQNRSITSPGWSITPSVTAAGGGACFSTVCSGSIEGFFAGPNAERAGVGYRIDDPSTGSVIGAAAFKKP